MAIKCDVLWPFVVVASKTFGGMAMMIVHIHAGPEGLILHFFDGIDVLSLNGLSL